MFSLIRKTYTQIAGLLHDLLDKFSDAGRTARQGLRELQEQIGQAEESVADVATELRLMKDGQTKALAKAAKWGQVAKNAADSNDRLTATDAVQNQVREEETAANLGRHVAHLVPMLDQLKARLSDLRQKHLDMQHKTSLLDARSKIADAETRAARSLGNVGNRPGIDFDQLEKQVDRKEAKAASLADMAHEKVSLDVDSRLVELSRRDAIGEKLLALGLPPVVDAAPGALQGASHA